MAALALVFVVSACGSDGDDALITIDGVEMMSVDDLGSTFDRSLIAPALNYGVQTEALVAELAERGAPLGDDARAAAQSELDDLRALDPTSVPEEGSTEIIFVTRRLAALHATADYLEAQGVVPAAAGTLCSSHILVETEEEAEAAITRLEAGEDFAALAMELSTGPSGPDGGDIGCFDTGSLDPGYVAGAQATPVGEVSAPALSSFGWHVILVQSFETAEVTDPVARRDAVLSTVEFAEFEASALADIEVEINPDFGTWDPVNGVTPVG